MRCIECNGTSKKKRIELNETEEVQLCVVTRNPVHITDYSFRELYVRNILNIEMNRINSLDNPKVHEENKEKGSGGGWCKFQCPNGTESVLASPSLHINLIPCRSVPSKFCYFPLYSSLLIPTHLFSVAVLHI